MASPIPNFAYCTLLTRSSYLAGVIILLHTLRQTKTPYPLVVLYTDTLPETSVKALELEVKHRNLILKPISALLPRENVHVHLIAERFADTWTKLRVFELFEYDTVCYLDADMILRKNMDAVFETELPPDCIAANHACVCNLDNDPWAPEDWRSENCAYTTVSHPDALTHPTAVTPASRPTHQLLNSGMFLFKPHAALWTRMLHFFNTTPLLSTFKFPDQDFLIEFFRGRWRSLGWQYNALKTMRYWHPNIWRDDEVVCLHYIVDKPWAKRVGDDGVAGYLGRDGETHKWWWAEYEKWQGGRRREGEDEVLELVRPHVAKPPADDDGVESEELAAIGSKVQAFAKNKAPAGGEKAEEKEDVEGVMEQKDADASNEPHIDGPVLGKKMLGERGHGPVVHDRPRANRSSMMEP
ncbi:hypothetical protein LTR66_007722 [Elasticomyces elasticus]|nr:hypothetical protein LTR66_007722 [Elasticomyces elasticus]